jgi:hypothetical protein
VNTATLALCLYATERLRVLGDAVPDLAGLDVKTLQPRLNALRRYAHARVGIEEDALYGEVFEPVFRVVARAFSIKATVEACEVALARRLGESVEVLRAAMSSGRSSVEASPVGDQIEDRSIVAIEHGADTPAMAIALFARKAGLDAALEAAPDSDFGCRLLELPADQCADTATRRAWSALALLIEPDRELEPAVLPPPSELIRWLADAGDDSAAAFLALLARLRQSPQVFQREAT